MATHSSVLAWRIPETGEPGGLPSMGSHRVGYDWSDLAARIVGNCLNIYSLILRSGKNCTFFSSLWVDTSCYCLVSHNLFNLLVSVVIIRPLFLQVQMNQMLLGLCFKSQIPRWLSLSSTCWLMPSMGSDRVRHDWSDLAAAAAAAADFQICFSKLNLFSKLKLVSDLVIGTYLSCFFLCF